ncbi:MAG: hypothetical protein ACRD2C_02020 [Acidimicrobiales bacterium]
MAVADASVVAITVVPERFTLVDYDPAAIAEVAADLRARVGLPTDLALQIQVDETTPLGRAYLDSTDPVVLIIESGAFEHLHRPRQFDPERSAEVLGRLLFRLRDRRDAAFGDPPPDDTLTLALSTAWDVYAMGRLSRMGYTAQRPRRLYQFRVRHGFSDEVDAIFARLWDAENLTWPAIEDLSAQATTAAT